MRVIGGTARGTLLKSVPGDSTRPILDRVRTSLFDILRPELPGLVMLDLFGGTGSVGIEALSQGGKHCTFLDINKAAYETIKSNVKAARVEDRAEVRHTDAFTYLKHTTKSFNLIYVAPPQYENLWVEACYRIAERPELLTGNKMIIAQIDPSEYEPLILAGFTEVDKRSYGKTLLVFYRPNPLIDQ
jgi:16S rRNA (guanine966-N2)-methyltransferase